MFSKVQPVLWPRPSPLYFFLVCPFAFSHILPSPCAAFLRLSSPAFLRLLTYYLRPVLLRFSYITFALFVWSAVTSSSFFPFSPVLLRLWLSFVGIVSRGFFFLFPFFSPQQFRKFCFPSASYTAFIFVFCCPTPQCKIIMQATCIPGSQHASHRSLFSPLRVFPLVPSLRILF